MPAVNDLDRLAYDVTGSFTRVILNHPDSKSIESDEETWDRIEDYLTKNRILYARLDPASAPNRGMILWLRTPHPHGAYAGKDDEIRSLSDLATFLSDTLKLDKSCLHFVFRELAITGDLKDHESFEAIEETVFEELAGQPVPEEARASTLEDLG